MGKKPPQQNPTTSFQEYRTPRIFLDAVEKRFGRIIYDLACNIENSVIGYFPDLIFTPDRSFLEATPVMLQAHSRALHGVAWLNPEFSQLTTFSRKCRELAPHLDTDLCIAMLAPASVGARWYWNNVEPWATVYGLRPRMSFDGKWVYPKDLILAIYRNHAIPGFHQWKWEPRPKQKPKGIIKKQMERKEAEREQADRVQAQGDADRDS